MDGERFDRLARLVGAGSRRRLLGAFAAGGLAALLEHGTVGAACRKKGAPCAKNRECCSGSCGAKGMCLCGGTGEGCRGDGDCCPGRACFADRCCAEKGRACRGDDDCCYGPCCGGVCCGFGQTCAGGGCVCRKEHQPCGPDECCPTKTGWHCCGDKTCCPPSRRCADGRCERCPDHHPVACGAACCGEDDRCADRPTSTCSGCPEGQVECGVDCIAPCDASACQKCDPDKGAYVSTCGPGEACQGGSCVCKDQTGYCCPHNNRVLCDTTCCQSATRCCVSPDGVASCCCGAQKTCYCQGTNGGWQMSCLIGYFQTCEEMGTTQGRTCVPAELSPPL